MSISLNILSFVICCLIISFLTLCPHQSYINQCLAYSPSLGNYCNYCKCYNYIYRYDNHISHIVHSSHKLFFIYCKKYGNRSHYHKHIHRPCYYSSEFRHNLSSVVSNFIHSVTLWKHENNRRHNPEAHHSSKCVTYQVVHFKESVWIRIYSIQA